MVYVYLFCSSLLLFFASAAATVRRDENTGIAWMILAGLAVLVTLLRIANTISKALCKRYSEERRKLTISDLMVFDGVMFVCYGILAGLGDDFSDAFAWVMLILVGIPVFLISAHVIAKRFRQAMHLRNVHYGLERR